jgi:hypothetical protein
MPAYNFKDQFVPLIQRGQKTTTIRQIRKQRKTRIGDRLYLFNRMRQSKCRLIKDTDCVALRPIRITLYRSLISVRLDGRRLAEEDVLNLAQRDGFSDITDFAMFFRKNYGPVFTGELIEWKP